MSELTEEQKKRIDENRRKALEKLAASKAREKLLYANISISNPGSSSTEQHKISDAECKKTTKLCSSKLYLTAGNYAVENVNKDIQAALKNETAKPRNVSNSSNFNCDTKAPAFYSHATSISSSKITLTQSIANNAQRKTSSATQSCFGETKVVTGTFVLFTRKRFFVEVGYHAQMIEIFKTCLSKMYDAKTKRWNFAINDHDKLVDSLKKLRPNVVVSPLPRNIVKLFSSCSSEKVISNYDLQTLDPVLLDALMPFQKKGVHFGIHLEGKVLLADDMGLGKTIQAIAIANYYKTDWPLLVVTPSSVRYSWAEEFRTWLPTFSSEVVVINSSKDHITNSKIVLMSYDLLTKKKDEILRRGFKSTIMDESHFLKNPKSARTKAAQQVMKQMKRIIMLSGTPALSRPVELFPQISAINPNMFPNFMEFGIRYCNGKKMPWGWDFSGSSHMEELNLLLKETLMIRRLKSEVMKQLPSKIRQVIVLDTSQVAIKNKILMTMSKKMTVSNLKSSERRGLLLEYFHETGVTKLPFICEYLKDLLEADKKLLCFAHHQVVLDGISKTIEDLNVKYIRIQGSTPSEQRKVLCDKFQMNDSYKVALLSITAANAGITLTSAHLVVFAELFWNPGILTQAEDRAHRIGQEDSVVIQYLVAKGTADDEIWPLVQRKLDILNKAGLSKDNFVNSETITSDNSSQPRIEDFWEELDSSVGLEIQNIPDIDCVKRQRLL